MVVRLKTDSPEILRYLELTPGNYYRVISVEGDYYRLMSDNGLASLYDTYLFDEISDRRPNDWIVKTRNDGSLDYAGPERFAVPGFWEDYWDEKKEALSMVRKRLGKWGHGEDRLINEGIKHRNKGGKGDENA